jgi:late competence protein required for DNA uptake (superfamily II DNA/RNA helicase)
VCFKHFPECGNLYGERKEGVVKTWYKSEQVDNTYPAKKIPPFVFKLFPSQVFFHKHYNPSHNTLYFAGTNSGKSICERIAINGVLLTTKKVVLIATTVALCREKKTAMIQMEGYGSDIVGIVTGQHKKDFNKPLIVTSPERYISALRNKEPWGMNADLVVVDEVHNILRPNRGEIIEAVLTLAKTMGKRILGLTGTMPQEYKVKLAEWLEADVFESDYSPSVVTTHYRQKSDKLSELMLQLKKYEGNHILIFTPTTGQAEAVAKAIKSPFFHSKMDDKYTETYKQKVLENFRTGKYKILVSTSGLSEGINLPIDTVILYGTRRGEDSYIDSIEAKQMGARAARYPKVKGDFIVIGDIWEIAWAKNNVNLRVMSPPVGDVTLTLLSGEKRKKDEVKSVVLSSFGASFKSNSLKESGLLFEEYIDDMVESSIINREGDLLGLTPAGFLLSRYFLPSTQYSEYVSFANKFVGKIEETMESSDPTEENEDVYSRESDNNNRLKPVEFYSILISTLLKGNAMYDNRIFLTRLSHKMTQNDLIFPANPATCAAILEAFVTGKKKGIKNLSYSLYSDMGRWMNAFDEISKANPVPFLSSLKVWVKRLRAVLHKKKVKKTTGQVVLSENKEAKGVTADEFIMKIKSASNKLLPAFKNSFESLSFSEEDKQRIKEVIDTREKELKVVSIAA